LNLMHLTHKSLKMTTFPFSMLCLVYGVPSLKRERRQHTKVPVNGMPLAHQQHSKHTNSNTSPADHWGCVPNQKRHTSLVICRRKYPSVVALGLGHLLPADSPGVNILGDGFLYVVVGERLPVSPTCPPGLCLIVDKDDE
jgi:hypothetical protein